MMKHNRILAAVGGFFAGALNGLLGAGGGMVVVPLLDKAGLPPKKSHATSVCVILPICIFSAVLYLQSFCMQVMIGIDTIIMVSHLKKEMKRQY